MTVAIFTAFVIWHSPKKTTLVILQKAMLVAKTENDRQKVLSQLDQYYLTLFIPDSIRQHVQTDVDTLIRRQERSQSPPHFSIPDTNVYVLEGQLKNLLREVMIARCRRDETTVQTLLTYAKVLADTVDIGTHNQYWHPFIARVAAFNIAKAKTWLLADRSERLCTFYHGLDFLKAEQYGALGLQNLQKIEDNRIQQDIFQRLLTILYQFRGLYDLSYPCFTREIQESEKIKYQLRATGLLFHYASALLYAGRNITASEIFWLTIHKAEEFRRIPDMNWYQNSGYIGIANTKRRLGNYREALSISNRIETKQLDIGQQITMNLSRGISHIYFGDYDNSEKEYGKALSLAVQYHDIPNEIITLRNFGLLYFRLTEYEKAIYYYEKAMKALEEFSPKNIEQKCRLLINLAETKVEQGEMKISEHLIEQAETLIRLLDLPTVKGEMLQSLGRLNLKLGKYLQSHQLFQDAVILYEKNGLLRESLDVKNEMIGSLIKLANLKKAKDLLEETYKLAAEIQDVENEIESIGMMAEIACKEGDLEKAIQKSNQITKEIESVSARFNNTDNLTFYRQKVYDYLKNAVKYEIELGRVDSAFIKLDYIKARAAKNELKKFADSSSNHESYFLNIDSLKTRLTNSLLIINYFMTQDTLYAFVLDDERVFLLKHAIQNDEIEKMISAFLNVLYASPHVFQDHQPSAVEAQYFSSAQLSQRLYQILFGWPELQERFKQIDVTYIIPDGILYALPFHCLMEKSGEDPRFLIQQTAIVNLPSVIFLQSPKKREVETSPYDFKVLISADHNFPGSDVFIKSIKKQFPLAEELLVSNPTHLKESILSKLNCKYDLYIFLGHSVADTTMPDSSYFNLTAINPPDLQLTAKVTLADLKRIDWSDTEMVCLIGCETAKGKLYRGSGLTGMQQNMLTLGAKQVLASYWQIDARIAISQVTEFFKIWPQKQGSAMALQQVQIQAIREFETDTYFKNPHPFLWGSFTLAQTVSCE